MLVRGSGVTNALCHLKELSFLPVLEPYCAAIVEIGVWGSGDTFPSAAPTFAEGVPTSGTGAEGGVCCCGPTVSDIVSSAAP